MILNIRHILTTPKYIAPVLTSAQSSWKTYPSKVLLISFCVINKVSCVQDQSLDFLSLNMLFLHFSLVNGISKLSVAQVNAFGVNPNSSFSHPQIQTKQIMPILPSTDFLKHMLMCPNDYNSFILWNTFRFLEAPTSRNKFHDWFIIKICTIHI